MIGDPDRYVKAGSTVILRCVVRGALEPPSYIIWYHGIKQIYAENNRGWKIQIDRGTPDIDGDSHSSVSLVVILTILAINELISEHFHLSNRWVH